MLAIKEVILMAIAPPLTCTEALEIIRKAPLHASVLFGRGEILSAMNHYTRCRECLHIGLTKLTGQALTCQGAVEAFCKLQHARNPAVSLLVGMIWEALVHEHIWGRELCLNPDEPYYKQQFGRISPPCLFPVCRAIVTHWDLGFGHPFPLDQEGYLELLRRMPSRIRPLMVEQGWPTDTVDPIFRSWSA